MYKKYEGELNEVNPFNLGVELRRKNESLSKDGNDPSECYHGDKDNDPIWDFLDNFRLELENGWWREDVKIRTKLYYEQLSLFQKNLPEIGSVVFIEYPNNLGKYFECKIKYISENKDAIVIEELKERNKNKRSGNYGSKEKLVEYSYPGKFPSFYNSIPKK